MAFKNFFSEQASKPAGLFGRLVMARVFDLGNVVVNDLMQEHLSIKEDDQILEIGSGTGKLINEMAGRVANGCIEGLDLSETMVALAQKKNKKHIASGKVTIRQGDFGKTIYNDNSFDKICSANTIYFWPAPEVYLEKTHRILKPGGKLVLAFEDKRQLEKRSLNTDVFRFYDQTEIISLLGAQGFGENINIFSRKVKKNRFHCAVAVK